MTNNATNVGGSTAAPRRAVAEIISIGDEILTGKILDTNSQYLSESLSGAGVRVLYMSTIGDEFDAMVAAFRTAFRRADVVLVTGGLGPTQDDLTRSAVAAALGVELKFDRKSFEHTKNLFARRGRPVPESNRIQAFFPAGSRVIFNPNGTAPGFLFEGAREKLADETDVKTVKTGAANRSNGAWSSDFSDSGRFVVLTFPGVPAEMREMWRGADAETEKTALAEAAPFDAKSETPGEFPLVFGGRAAVAEFVDRLAGGNRPIFREKAIHSFGAGESAIEARLPNLIAREHSPRVGITAKESVITLRIFAEGATVADCEAQIDETARTIYSDVGEFVFGEDDETFASVVCRNLRAQCRRVGVFEWGTRGFLVTKFEADVLGFGRVFGEAERDAFERLFGATDDETLEKRAGNDVFAAASLAVGNGISPELREILAAERGAVDYCLAVGPYPAVDANGEKAQNAETVVAFVDLRDPERPVWRRETFRFGGHPAVIDPMFCNRAFDMLRKYQ